MPEWTDPRTWAPQEKVRAADLNAQLRDNLLVLLDLGSRKAERLQLSDRDAADGGADFGPLADNEGPSVQFRTGPSGNATVMLYAQGRVTEEGAGSGFASFTITRLSDSEVVVGPSVVRALRWSATTLMSANFGPWVEHLDPDEEYELAMVYQAPPGAVAVECRSRRVQASEVRPLAEEA